VEVGLAVVWIEERRQKCGRDRIPNSILRKGRWALEEGHDIHVARSEPVGLLLVFNETAVDPLKTVLQSGASKLGPVRQ